MLCCLWKIVFRTFRTWASELLESYSALHESSAWFLAPVFTVWFLLLQIAKYWPQMGQRQGSINFMLLGRAHIKQIQQARSYYGTKQPTSTPLDSAQSWWSRVPFLLKNTWRFYQSRSSVVWSPEHRVNAPPLKTVDEAKNYLLDNYREHHAASDALDFGSPTVRAELNLRSGEGERQPPMPK